MKTFTAVMTALFCCCLIISCNDDSTKVLGGYDDNTLAGSVIIDGYRIVEAEGLSDGTMLENFQSEGSLIDINKVSDTEVSLSCICVWDEMKYEISIPIIALYGMPYDVTFNTSSNNVEIICNGRKYTEASATASGWIRKTGMQQSYNTRSNDPATPDYDCVIYVQCIMEGESFCFRINKVQPF